MAQPKKKMNKITIRIIKYVFKEILEKKKKLAGKCGHDGRQGPGSLEVTGPLPWAQISAAHPSWGPQSVGPGAEVFPRLEMEGACSKE